MAEILVIDDESEVRYAIRAVLEDNGHTITEAGTGTEGIAAFKLKSFDLVICDIIMPEKEGIETISELKELKPEQLIIAISGGGRIRKEDYLAIATSIGATHTISKPFDAITLVELTNSVLQR